MRCRLRSSFIIGVCFLAPGCAEGPRLVPVEGRVTLEGKPVKAVVVTFSPIGETEGIGAHGYTDAEGRFSLTDVRGGKGVRVGVYFVSLVSSASDRKEGDPLDVIGKAGGATIPGIYMDPAQTQLRASVPEGGGFVEITLTRSGRGATTKTNPR